jgi:ribosomal protein S18 acetylase RimI-like enzyme
MSPTLKILRASIEDVPSLAPLFDAYRVFYGRPSDLNVAERFLLDRLSSEESVIFFCRQSPSGLAAGFIQLYPSFSSVSAGRTWILNDLFVAPEARRLGVARMLILAAHDHARETGALRVILSTAHSNQSAQALYESIGYVRDTEFRSYSFQTRSTTS